MILRDRDNPEAAWTDEAYDKRTQRHYDAQNWRADVSAILTDDGSMVEWVKYSAYGVPFGLPAGDSDSDGDWDGDDKGRIGSGAYDVRKDVNLDGVADSDDIDQGNAVTGGNHTLGRGVLSAGGVGGAVGNRRGYAGYEYAPELEGTGAAGRHLYHVRHRVYDADVGRWTRRDPLGYVDGMGLYEYVGSKPVMLQDPMGLAPWKGNAQTCADQHFTRITRGREHGLACGSNLRNELNKCCSTYLAVWPPTVTQIEIYVGCINDAEEAYYKCSAARPPPPPTPAPTYPPPPGFKRETDCFGVCLQVQGILAAFCMSGSIVTRGACLQNLSAQFHECVSCCGHRAATAGVHDCALKFWIDFWEDFGWNPSDIVPTCPTDLIPDSLLGRYQVGVRECATCGA